MVSDILDHPVHENWQLASLLEQIPCQKQGNTVPPPLLSPITRRQILDSSNLKEFADDNFKFDKNGRKLSKWVENTVGKGEIARYEQFLLFLVFSKGLFPRGVKRCHCVGMGQLCFTHKIMYPVQGSVDFP